jgi:hypothetical protein
MSAYSVWIDYELSANFEHYSDQETIFKNLLEPLGLDEDGSGGGIGSGWRDISFEVPEGTDIDILFETLKIDLGFDFHATFDTEESTDGDRPIGGVAVALSCGTLIMIHYGERDLDEARLYIAAMAASAPWMSVEDLYRRTNALVLEEYHASITHQPKLRCLTAATCQLLGDWQQVDDLRFVVADTTCTASACSPDSHFGSVQGLQFTSVADFKTYVRCGFSPAELSKMAGP